MNTSTDGLYKLFVDSANSVATGATVAVWDVVTRAPHPDYPDTADFLEQYGDQIPPYVPMPPYEPPPEEG